MIKVRLVIMNDDRQRIKEKLASHNMPLVPRKGEALAINKRDFKVDEVAWDLELDPVEAVLFLIEVKR